MIVHSYMHVLPAVLMQVVILPVEYGVQLVGMLRQATPEMRRRVLHELVGDTQYSICS